MPNKLTNEEYKIRIHNKFGDKLDLSNVYYDNMRTIINPICSIHGSFYIEAERLVYNKFPCPKCSPTFKLTPESIIKLANKKHNNEYIYPVKNLPFKTNKDKMIITCKKHGDFKMVINNHLTGNICPICAEEKRCESLSNLDHIGFMEKSNKIHNFKYEYISEYKRSRMKVEIKCPEHGIFKQEANSHMMGHGCPKCGEENKIYHRISRENSIDRANKKHNFKYNYDSVEFKTVTDKVNIKCNEHGFFTQTWNEHYNYGSGCPKCTNIISKPEIEVANFVESLNLEILTSKRNIIKPYELDIYIPELNKAIEFNGTYWHYSKKLFRPGYHAMKSNLCKEKGIKLLHIREDLWIRDKEQMKEVISKFLKIPLHNPN